MACSSPLYSRHCASLDQIIKRLNMIIRSRIHTLIDDSFLISSILLIKSFNQHNERCLLSNALDPLVIFSPIEDQDQKHKEILEIRSGIDEAHVKTMNIPLSLFFMQLPIAQICNSYKKTCFRQEKWILRQEVRSQAEDEGNETYDAEPDDDEEADESDVKDEL
ncbi:hypothetical protein Tco_0309293 [Tanacetum coccineum]